MLRPLVLLSAAFLSIPAPAPAGTLHVPVDHSTVRAALAGASPGDTIEVAWGTYHEHDIPMKSAVVLRSQRGRADWVTLDADSLGWVFLCDGVDSTAVIEGFTITGGWDIYGGGMYCRNHSSPTLVRCTLAGNAACFGAALYCRDASRPRFVDCTFRDNTAACGGIVCSYGRSEPILENCRFVGRGNDANARPVYCRTTSGRGAESAASLLDETGRTVAPGEGMTCCDLYDTETVGILACLGQQMGTEGDTVVAPGCAPATTATTAAGCAPGAPAPPGGFIGASGIECVVGQVGGEDAPPPETFYLGGAVPNRLNPVMEITYGIPASPDTARAVLNLHDSSGERVRTLIDGFHPPGTYRVLWNYTNDKGAPVGPGLYFLRLVWKGEDRTRRIRIE